MKGKLLFVLVLTMVPVIFFGCSAIKLKNNESLTNDYSTNETLFNNNEQIASDLINRDNYSMVENLVIVTNFNQIHNALSECFSAKNTLPYVLIIDNPNNLKELCDYDMKKPAFSDVFQIHGNLSDFCGHINDEFFNEHYVIALVFKSSSGSWNYEQTVEKIQNALYITTIGKIDFPCADDVGGFIIICEVDGRYGGENVLVYSTTSEPF